MGSVLVAQGDELLFSKGYGLANIATATANTPETRHRTGSITKSFTAALVLKLQEAGRLSVNDPLNLYLPEFPGSNIITLHHLLTHSAGLVPNERLEGEGPYSLAALVASFQDEPRLFGPGERFSYSNAGYLVLTEVVARVTGQPFSAWMEEHELRNSTFI